MYQQKKQLIKSGILISVIIFILFFALPLLIHSTFNSSALILCFMLILVSILSPYSLNKPLEYWIKFGDILSRINSNIILAVFFYLILFPSAIVRRIIKLFKLTKGKKDSKSYYQRKNLSESNLSDQY